jgi:bifunctional pyridoxal-dependent enzyme with beta-cystathionase and maltose regulon repressor activities
MRVHGLDDLRDLPALASDEARLSRLFGWLDFRALGLDAPALARWLADSGLALSPGHWFGREGAGFARMTIATDRSEIAGAVDRLNEAAG